jgi:hypothetical protein
LVQRIANFLELCDSHLRFPRGKPLKYLSKSGDQKRADLQRKGGCEVDQAQLSADDLTGSMCELLSPFLFAPLFLGFALHGRGIRRRSRGPRLGLRQCVGQALATEAIAECIRSGGVWVLLDGDAAAALGDRINVEVECVDD